MIEKLTDLYNTKRWLFWCLIPITAFAMGVKYYLDYLEYKSEKDMNETRSQDQKIRFEQRQARQKAKEEKRKADALQNKIDDRKEEDISEDWNKE